MKNKHEKNIYIELDEQTKLDVELISARCVVKGLKLSTDTDTPKTVEQLLEATGDAFKSE